MKLDNFYIPSNNFQAINPEDYSIPNMEEFNWASSLGLNPFVEHWGFRPLNRINTRRRAQ